MSEVEITFERINEIIKENGFKHPPSLYEILIPKNMRPDIEKIAIEMIISWGFSVEETSQKIDDLLKHINDGTFKMFGYQTRFADVEKIAIIQINPSHP